MTKVVCEKSEARAQRAAVRTKTFTVKPGSRVTAMVCGGGDDGSIVTKVCTDGAWVRIVGTNKVEFIAWKNLLVCLG